MKTIAIALAALLCVPAVASAETYSVPLGSGQQVGDGIQYNFNYSDFDQSLGTLNTATLNLAGFYNAAVRVVGAFSYNPVQFSSTTLELNNITLRDFGAKTAPFVEDTATASFSFGFSQVIPNVFVNSGRVSDSFFIHGGQGIANRQGGSTTDVSSLMLSTRSITYDYTPFNAVPEPASMALLALGVLGAAKVSRKRSTAA